MLNKVKMAVVDLDIREVENLVEKALKSGFEPMAVLQALREGLEEIGRRFESREYFVSELIMGGEVMKAALGILKPFLKYEGEQAGEKVVLGTIVGDLHDIGKEIVKALLISSGFKVYDLGIDVPPEKFVEKAEETGARVIGVSALLSTSILNTTKIVEVLREKGLREKVKVIVGGAAARPWMVEKYGVDAAVVDAIEGLHIIGEWTKEWNRVRDS